MGKAQDVFYQRKFRFRRKKLDYVFQLKKKRSWWWLLWLLLPLLLLIRCERDITVTCIDGRTEMPVQDVNVKLDYTAHFLYDKGVLFANVPVEREMQTDENGEAEFRNLECSVYSYIFYCLSKVRATADDCDEKSELFHFTKNILFVIENIDCAVDIVMCVDDTGSMDDLIDMVKSNALNFCDDLYDYCAARRRNLKFIRLKVIPFGDLREKPITPSRMFVIPDEKSDYQAFVNTINADGGGDEPENGLEALAMAINTDWVESSYRLRHIIIVYTNASAHKLENPYTHTKYYPSGMPENLNQLQSRWEAMNTDAQRLVLFAPDKYPWNEMADDWDNVSHKTENLKTVLTGSGYEDILEAIHKSL